MLGHALEVVGGARRDRAEHHLLGHAAAEQHRHVVEQLLARLQVAVLGGQVQRVAERAPARHDRDPVHAVDRRQQLAAQRVPGLVVGDDPLLVLVQHAARLHARDHPLERCVEVLVVDPLAPRRAAKIAASLQMFARSAPVSPLVCWATSPRSTSPSGLLRVCTPSTPSRPLTSGGATNIWRSKRPGRSSAGSSFSSRFDAAITTTRPLRGEAVHLDQQLVERLVLLAGDVHAAAPADGVELVDEDDRRLVLARDREQPADARRAEAGEHLDERRGRLRRRTARRTRARPPSPAASCRCPAARAGGCPSAPSRPAPRNCFGVAQELDDLLQLAARLVDAGDVLPADRLLEDGLICCGLTRGITFSIRHITTMIATKNRIATTGSNCSAQFWRFCTNEMCGAGGTARPHHRSCRVRMGVHQRGVREEGIVRREGCAAAPCPADGVAQRARRSPHRRP